MELKIETGRGEPPATCCCERSGENTEKDFCGIHSETVTVLRPEEQPQELTCFAQGQRGVESVTIRNLTWPALPTPVFMYAHCSLTFTTAFVLSFRFSGNFTHTLELNT